MKDGFLKVGTATPKIRVADCGYNAGAAIALAREAADKGVKVLVLPELCLTGYTCGDLFFQDALLDAAEDALDRVLRETADCDLLLALGLPVRCGGKLYNCAAVCCRGKLLGLVPKRFLPNYGEFYEKRWFARAPGEDGEARILGKSVPFGTKRLFACAQMPALKIGVEICEDLWASEPPSGALAAAGATVILNLSASNELVGKASYRRALVSGQSARLLAAYLYADAGEGESTTDIVFAGHDLIAENGEVLAERRFASGLLVTELDLGRLAFERRRLTSFEPGPALPETEFSLKPCRTALTRAFPRNPFVPENDSDRAARCGEILNIQALGLAKRMEHTGARRMVVGVSGGLDSTLAAIVAAKTAEKLGLPKTALLAVTMPCFGTTGRTRSNAEKLAAALGAELRVVDIGEAVKLHFDDIGHDPQVRDVVYENSQARERTQVLMDLSNAENAILVGTGDMSELALGWATYNGDHMSMYGVNAGVPKTLVRFVIAWYADTCGSAGLAAVLRDILDTPVSPELLPAVDGEISQKTEDLVGPYELHDFFLYYMVRWGFTPEKTLRMAQRAFAGEYGPETIEKWLRVFCRRFFSQQFKRSCLPDGPKVGTLSLSPRGDWRMPSDASNAVWLGGEGK